MRFPRPVAEANGPIRPLGARGRATALMLGLAALVAAGLAACGSPGVPASQAGQSEQGAPPSGPGQVIASPSGFYVDPNGPAPSQVRAWRAAGRTTDADQLEKLADQPVPLWATGDPARVTAQVRGFVDAATRARQRPQLVLYNIPGRDCGQFSAGGAPDADHYRAWVGKVLDGLGARPATVIVEPDAVPHEVDGCGRNAAGTDRPALLAETVGRLKDSGPVQVYLDAGNPGFVSDTEQVANALRRSGVAKADGFSLNVANFRTTDENVGYGTEISTALGGAHFVIDTSRNGKGPLEGDTGDGPSFCNPPGRALGTPPTVHTGRDRVDAYLWIKRPGESDGACRDGEPAAGKWWPEYALALAAHTP